MPIVELPVLVSDPDELPAGPRAQGIGLAIQVVAARLDLVVPGIEGRAGGILLSSRDAVVLGAEDVAVAARNADGLRGKDRTGYRACRLGTSRRCIGPLGRPEGVSILVVRALRRHDRHRAEELRQPDPEIGSSLLARRVPGRRVEAHRRRHVEFAQALTGIGAGRSGVDEGSEKTVPTMVVEEAMFHVSFPE